MSPQRPGGRVLSAIDWPLLAIVLVALVVRAAAAVLFDGPIDGLGAEYGRIAENLLAGEGYSGLATPGAQLFYPPFFPFAIAAVSSVVGDIETAGRILSVVLGALLVLPVHGIAFRLYGRGVALLAAALVAAHPRLIETSTMVNVETAYLTLSFATILLIIAAMQDLKPRSFVAAGLLAGLTYLTRQEIVLFLAGAILVTCLYLLLRRLAKPAAVAARVGLLLAGFAVLAAPYALWLSVQTGEFHLEGKSPLNISTEILTERATATGADPVAVQYGVDQDLSETGIWNRPNAEVIHEYAIPGSEVAVFIVKKLRDVIESAARYIPGSEVGTPLLFGLAMLGLFARPWSASAAAEHALMLGLLAVAIIATLFIYYMSPRYYVVSIPIFCIWGAAGLGELTHWALETGREIGLPTRLRAPAAWASCAAVVGAALALSGLAACRDLAWSHGERAIEAAGRALRAPGGEPLRVAGVDNLVSFYAGATHVWLPAADEQTALAYIAAKSVDYVVVRSSAAGGRSYLNDWIANGAPGMTPVQSVVTDVGETVTIYDARN